MPTPEEIRKQVMAEAAERAEEAVAQAARDEAKAEADRRRREGQAEQAAATLAQGYVGTIGAGDMATGGARATRRQGKPAG